MIAKVIPVKRMPLKLSHLDYIVPKEIEDKVKIGQLIKIPFRNKEIFGVIQDIKKTTALEKSKKIKKILEIVFQSVILSKEQLDFLDEISQIYHCSVGYLLKGNLIPLKKNKLKKVELDAVSTMTKNKQNKPLAVSINTMEDINNYLSKNIAGGQNLILVPEIEDISKIELSKKFNNRTVFLDSNISEKHLFNLWLDIHCGNKDIIIGTRKTLFLPWFNLQNIFVVFEGNPSYKSWDMAPRFHTRDAALMLSSRFKAQLHLIDHTLSVDTYFFQKNRVYKSIITSSVKRNYNIKIVDMRKERQNHNYGFLSDVVLDELKNQRGDVFVFLNRRGSSSYVGCRDCGHVLKCKNCLNLLTYHQDQNSLKCHYCKTEFEMPKNCLKCQGLNISMYGVGTQLAENEIKKNICNLSATKVLRIDADVSKIEVDKKRKNIVIGTQYALPHLNWKKISSVIFLDADTSLFVPEYKVSETLWYTIKNTMFNTKKDADIIIQTSHLDHPVFANITNQTNYYNTELQQRKIFNYPPYEYLVRMFYQDFNKVDVENTVNKVKKKLDSLTKQQNSITISGPFESMPYYKNGKYCQILLAKIKYSSYKKDIKHISSLLGDKWKVDPNPNNILTT